MTEWYVECCAVVRRQGLDPTLLEVLQAFGGPRAHKALSLDESALPDAIVSHLADEVDIDQARLFARRFTQLGTLLEGMPQPEASLFARALNARAAEILFAPPPRALRVRALVDFYLSQASVLRHRDPSALSLHDRLADPDWKQVVAGVRHALVAGPTQTGPVHLNVLALSGVRLEALDTRALDTDLARLCASRGAVAGFSGGFFLYSEPDITSPSVRTDPVGTLVTDGRVVGPPVFRRAALTQHHDGSCHIEVLGPRQATFQVRDVSVRVVSVNGEGGEGPALWNRAAADHSPASAYAIAFVGDRVVAAAPGPLAVPLAGAVLTLSQPVPAAAGDAITCRLHAPIATAMGGGPTLLGPGARSLVREDFAGSAPPITFSRDETYDRNLLPRLAVGRCDDGSVRVVAVDGRNVERAPGLTLRQTADALTALGCTSGLNLDGGSSKRMVVAGRVVDLPSTDVITAGDTGPVRPVHSAVLVHARP